jgi:Xaa-Pro aminopeptidase
VNAKEFARRRKYLMELIGVHGIAVVATAPERIRSRDTHYPYRADSDFYYLTGFGEPEAVAVLVPGRPQGEFLLFCRERNPEREQWDGPRAGQDGAIADYDADDAFPIADLDDILPGLLERSDRVYYSISGNEFDQRLLSFIHALNNTRQSGHAPREIIALDHLLHEMRLFKSRAETAVMRQSASIAVDAHRRAMQVCRPGMKEYELEAEFVHEFTRNGAQCSYPPIVAAGANACVLHYRSNDAELRDGDLVLIDAGCELAMYASDITRTFPVNGRFSPAQRDLYEVVLEANRAAMAKAVVGNHWNDPHDTAVAVVTKGLKDLGLLRGRVPQLVKSLAYRQFFMHKTGHWLGLDVHDVGDYKVAEQWRLLEPGMVMTIEPGIYVSPGDRSVDKRWRGIGIRIEDDVQVAREGAPEVLSAGLPATVEEIEGHMAAAA